MVKSIFCRSLYQFPAFWAQHPIWPLDSPSILFSGLGLRMIPSTRVSIQSRRAIMFSRVIDPLLDPHIEL